VRPFLVFLFPSILAAQTLQFGAAFGGSCISLECDMGHVWYPDTVTGIAVDSAGNSYVAGTSFGFFPLVNAIEPSPYQLLIHMTGNGSIPFLAKIDPTGTKLLYATPIGEPQGGDRFLPISVTVDASGNAYVTGAAPAGGFPTLNGITPESEISSQGSNHVFFIKLDPNGKLLLSTRFGGSSTDTGNCIALDASGAIWITGTTQSSDFPVTTGHSLSSSQEIFLAKLDPTSGDLTYATLLGQGANPQLAVGPPGDFLIAASTTSSSWVTTPGAVQSSCAGSSCADVIALRFRPSTSQIVYATYLGGTGIDTLGGMAVDSTGSVYLTGTTASYDFPTTPGAFATDYQCSVVAPTTCGTKAFAAHLNPTGTALKYSTYLGGSATDEGHAVTIDAAGNAYIAGQTTSSDFPILRAIQPAIVPTKCHVYYPYDNYCRGAGFLTVLNPQASALVWSTYLGEYPSLVPVDAQNFNGAEAVAVDAHGDVYVAGDDLALNPPNVNPPSTVTPMDAFADASVVKITPTGQPLRIAGLTNAASFAPGLPAPGGLASLFLSGLTGQPSILTGTGIPLPTTLGGFTLKIRGEPAPLLAVATFDGGRDQINFQVPFEQGQASPNNSAPIVEIDFNGTATFLGATAVAPGIFTLADGSPAIEHASDFSVVSQTNGINVGEIITIYMTGLGIYSTGAQSGVPAAAPAPPQFYMPTVTIGGSNCAVLYAGPTLEFVGLDQINCRTSSQNFTGPKPFAPLQVVLPNPLLDPPDPNVTNSNSVLVWINL
jgi:uncharacterized protein (TIGR03437 family)